MAKTISVDKEELVRRMAEATGATQKQVRYFLEAFTGAVKQALADGEEVKLVGFGTFKIIERKAREVKHPRTKEIVSVPATKVPVFRPGKELRGVVR